MQLENSVGITQHDSAQPPDVSVLPPLQEDDGSDRCLDLLLLAAIQSVQ